jgi:cyclopropane fatty-acyl-phospholipid synthase-like methyltransferase
MRIRQAIRRLKASFGAGPARHGLVGPAKLAGMKRAFQIDFLRRQGLRPEHRLVDIGCGTLRGGIPIIDYLARGNYCGIEARRYVLDQGIAELRENGLEGKEPMLISDDLGDISLPGRFDFAWAFSVLFHMADARLEDCFRFVSTHLASDGVFFANARIGAHDEGRWQEFPVVWRSLEYYDRLASRYGLHTMDIGSLGEVGHVSGKPGQDEQRMLKFTRRDAVVS